MYWLPVVFMCVAQGQSMECGFIAKQAAQTEQMCGVELRQMIEDFTPMPAVKAIDGACIKVQAPTI